jgi:ribosomal protein S27AE
MSGSQPKASYTGVTIGEATMPRKKKTDFRDLLKIEKKTENLKACDRCGGFMAETETGRQCLSCELTEWIQEDGTYTSGIAKCPSCGNMSPNILICSYCSYPIDEKTRKLWESKEK